MALVFEHLEPSNSWLRSSAAIREELRKIAETLISYAVALLVAREFRLKVGNVDLMSKDCHGKTEKEITELLTQSAEEEKDRVGKSLDAGAISAATKGYFQDLTLALAQDNPVWKDAIPGKPLLARFASKARIDTPRLKTAYIHCAKGRDPSPFKELEEIFSSFAAA